MGHRKVTRSRAGSAASKVLRGNYSKAAKSAAGSALSQRPGRHRKK